MIYYTLCATPCVIKLNGEVIGTADENLSFVETDEGYFEFIPIDGSFLPVGVFLGEKYREYNKLVKIIDLYGGFLLMPSFTRRVDSEYKTIGKKSFDLSLPTFVTCYNQCGIKLCIERQNERHDESLPFFPSDIRFETARFKGQEYIVVICVGVKTLIVGFSLNGGIRVVFRSLCDGYGFERNRLSILENKKDLLRHTLSSTWEFGEQVSLISYSVTRKKQPYALNEKLIPYAFFEEILISGSPSDFLTPKLKPKADDLRSFLGDFKKALPPPHFRDQDLITLLYNDKVEYVKLTFSGGLIDDISLIDK